VGHIEILSVDARGSCHLEGRLSQLGFGRARVGRGSLPGGLALSAISVGSRSSSKTAPTHLKSSHTPLWNWYSSAEYFLFFW